MISRRPLFTLLIVALCATSGLAQTTANLTGTVTLGGSPTAGITVTISSPNLIGTRTAVSDSNGNYNFAALPPGDYSVRFELEGIKPQTKTVRIGLAQTARSDADLQLTSEETLVVTATSPAVSDTTEVQTNVRAKLVEELPLGRTLIATANLTPGVTQNGPGGATVISGAPSFDSLFMVDGAVVNENLRGQPHDLFIEDAIQETTVLTGAISAEFGRFTGGVVTAISKTGGNEFSGTFRDSLQSPKWTALSPGDDRVRGKNVNQTYEATLGGRIIRDRLWFFAAGRQFEQSQSRVTFGNGPQYTYGREQSRLEAKLTGQITPRHSLTVSSLDIQDKESNNAFPSAAQTWELRSLDVGRELPNSFLTAHYNGVITNSFLIEGLYAKKDFSFVGSGGDAVDDVVLGSNGVDIDGNRFGGPSFCGACGDEERDNRNYSVKGTYFLSTAAVGTHNVVAGYDDWLSMRKSDNHQSASDFTVLLYEVADADCPDCGIHRQSDGSIRIGARTASTLLVYWPILESSKGTRLSTKSAFINDKWDFNDRLSFNLGVRYDKNVGRDGARQLTADDSKISPRLGVMYDVKGDGRIRLNGSYSQYVSAIADGNVADSASPAGSPSYLYWLYYGDDLRNKTSVDFFKGIFDWFNSVGGINNTDFLLGGKTNGLGSRIPEPLASPYVSEWTVGVGTQIGTRGFVRADYINREWSNFYTAITNHTTGVVFDPLKGADVDIATVTTTNDFERRYRALQLQASYTPFSRLTLGGNYTHSTLRGNHGAETAGSGPVPNGGIQNFPEVLGYAQINPVGYLTADQRHKLRAWVSYDQPTPVGTINVSVLQRYDSGTPYSAIGLIDPRWRLDSTTGAYSRPSQGYLSPPTSANYYFSKRGEFRTDDITATDLALNWNFPLVLGKMQFYVQSELRNIFNEQGVVTVNQTVATNKQSPDLRRFDPTKETPIEGVHWSRGPNFGRPETGTTFDQAGDYQLPRTFLVSAGLRF